MANKWVRATNGAQIYTINLNNVAYMHRSGANTIVHFGNGVSVTVGQTPEQLTQLVDELIAQ